ncbi:MAG: sugar ABC transporter substrate-binding protein [Propionibacteriaceae bacterium]|nr:sugar ABC transporter substrate-binding protein [Propionibacteriaceae bacterium]
MERKRIALGLVAAATALAVSACTNAGTPATTSGESNPPAGEKATIVWNMWAGDTEAEQKLKDQMAVAQELVGDDITIELQTAPWSDFFTKLNANLASGQLACVTAMNGQRLSGYTEAFLELTDADLAAMGTSRDAYEAGALAPMEVGGTLYNLPYDTASMVMYYNADLFTQAGVPLPTNDWTIDDFQNAAQEITTKTGVKGFAVSVDEFQWLSLPMSKSGLQAVDESGKLDLTNPDFVAAATWYGELASKLGVSNPVASASDSGWTTAEFQNGKAAMIVEGTWMNGSLLSDELPFASGVVRLPKGDKGAYGVTLGSGYGIAKNCENKDAALKVLGALTGPEAQAVIAAQAGFPARTDSQPAFFASLPEKNREAVTAAFTASFEGATGQRVTPEWTQVAEAMPNNLVSVYTGQGTMADALADLQARFGG